MATKKKGWTSRHFLLAALFCITVFPVPAHASVPAHFRRVMIVMFENTDAGAALAQPFFARLAKRGAFLSRFYAETHPSQPNYIALVAGSTLGVKDDKNITLKDRSLADLLEKHGKTWKVYAENYPGACFLGAASGLYARKHVPFLSFLSIQQNPARCARIMAASRLDADIRSGRQPDFSLFIPNIDDDGPDTGVDYADRWFSRRFGLLLGDRRFMDGLLLIITFDEDSHWNGTTDVSHNRICTILYGDGARPGAISHKRYTHYSILRTIEDAWNLGNLGQEDARAQPIMDIWK